MSIELDVPLAFIRPIPPRPVGCAMLVAIHPKGGNDERDDVQHYMRGTMSDLETMPISDLIAIADRYGVRVQPLTPGRVEVHISAAASSVARAVAGRLRIRGVEIACHITRHAVRPRRERGVT